MARPELLWLARQGPVEHEQTTAGVERRPCRSEDRRRIGQLVQRVLEVGEVVFADLAGVGGSAWRIADPVTQTGGFDRWRGPGRPNPPRIRRRRAPGREPPRHGDEPAPAAAVDVDDATPA